MNHWMRKGEARDLRRRVDEFRAGIKRRLVESIGDDWVPASTLIMEYFALHGIKAGGGADGSEVTHELEILVQEGVLESKSVLDSNFLIDLYFYRKKS